MAASPPWKIYSAAQEYLGSTVYAEDAAAFVSIQGEGATIRRGHAKKDVVWTEGFEKISAGDSYDEAASIMLQRLDQRYLDAVAKRDAIHTAYLKAQAERAAR